MNNCFETCHTKTEKNDLSFFLLTHQNVVKIKLSTRHLVSSPARRRVELVSHFQTSQSAHTKRPTSPVWYMLITDILTMKICIDTVQEFLHWPRNNTRHDKQVILFKRPVVCLVLNWFSRRLREISGSKYHFSRHYFSFLRSPAGCFKFEFQSSQIWNDARPS